MLKIKRNKKLMIPVLAMILVVAMAGVAFATYQGWWNNAVNISDGSTHSSLYYSMKSQVVGTLGSYAHSGSSGTETLRITPQYYYNDELFSSHYKNATINATSTWVEKTWTLDGAFKTRFKLQNTSAGSYTIFSTDVGYFYDN